MTNEKLYEVLGDVNERYVKEAKTSKEEKKPAWVKWGAIAVCLCLMAMGGLLYNSLKPVDFKSMIEKGNVETALIVTNIDIEGTVAWYNKLTIDGQKLERYVGEQYIKTDTSTWFYPADVDNLKYLIEQTDDGTLSLWMFSSFGMNEGETHTYGDVLNIIYNVDSADDIVSITTRPIKSNNTDFGRAIQKEVGTHTYTNEEDIAIFYDIAKDVICYGAGSGSKADNQRFTYSFSTEDKDKLTTGESTYGTRCISIELIDGTTIDSWIYNALSGSFFEYGGIFTEPLTDEKVYALNEIFGIK